MYEEFQRLSASLKYIPLQIVPGTEKRKSKKDLEFEEQEKEEEKPPQWDYGKRNSTALV